MAVWLDDGTLGVKAVLRHHPQSAFKVRPVLNLIRGKHVEDARTMLAYTRRSAAPVITKVLMSAVANAENNDFMERGELYVHSCYVDEAGTIKRWRPRARGRAGRIRKRTCHITVVVARMPEDPSLN